MGVLISGVSLLQVCPYFRAVLISGVSTVLMGSNVNTVNVCIYSVLFIAAYVYAIKCV